jgi:hypothetical protein
MTDEPTTEKSYDGSLANLVKSLINDVLKESQRLAGDTALEKARKHIQHGVGDNTFLAVTALSTYIQAQAAERQAAATESLAKTAAKFQMSETTETNAQAIVDQRESKREYIASTYSLDTDTLTFLWAFRGILIDASIKSLSRPDRFDPYRRVTNEEVAWTLRLSEEQLLARLPRTDQESGEIDFTLLEEFDILHYGGDLDNPDVWLYGG